jgi:hypothetical protein
MHGVTMKYSFSVHFLIGFGYLKDETCFDMPRFKQTVTPSKRTLSLFTFLNPAFE